jgi:type IV secretion system protein TrbB
VQAFTEPLGDPWTIMLRRHAARVMTLDEYVAERRMTQQQRDAIAEAVRLKKNTLIGGVLNSGKTTALNALDAESARLWPAARTAYVQDRRDHAVRAGRPPAL